jgi:hypothetical protein
MGLLDNLYFGHNADFGGQAGSILDFLRNSQMQQNSYVPSSGFPSSDNQPNTIDSAPWPQGPVGAPPAAPPAGPIAVGNYQMPRIGDMSQFTPDPAAIPPNAQLTQGQAPQAPAASPGGLSAGLQGFFQNLHAGPIGALAGAVGSAAGLQSPEVQQNNQTAAYLVKNGMDPALAKSVVADPALLRSILPTVMGVGGTTDDIKEYQFAKKEDPSLTFAKFMQQKKAVSGEYSLTPQYGTDKDGNTILLQTGKSGEAIQTKLPEGVKVSSGVEKIDAGDHWILYDKRTGVSIGTQPKNVAEKASLETQGEARGKAIVALPTIINTTQQSLDLVDEMIKHPGRETATGVSGTFDPRNYFPGTSAKDFQVRAKQVEGRTFLSAFDQLRGAGAITEAEGQKATSAIARLDRSQSDSEYLAALNELKQVLSRGLEVARQRAGQPSQPAAPAAAPNSSLKAKYGLD